MIRIIEYGALTATKGGVESYIYNQIACLSKDKANKQVQFDFLVPNEDEKLAYEDELKGYGCKFYRAYRRWKNSFFGHYIDLYRFFKNCNKDYDIAVANYLDLQNINFLIIAKLFGLKTVAHAHSAHASRNSKYKILVAINKILGRIFIDNLFTCSAVAANWMFGESLVRSKKNHYFQINNGIDAAQFRFSTSVRKKVRDQLRLKPTTFILGNTGRMVPGKNQLFIVDILNEYLKLNEDAALIIVGDGPQKEAVIQEAVALGIRDKVILPGSQSNIHEWLQAMDVFVFPSLYEGLGISAIESQAAGLLTFVSDHVPEDINVSDMCHRIPLNKPAYFWAGEIDKYKSYVRKDTYDIISSAGYDSNACKDEYLDVYKKIIE